MGDLKDENILLCQRGYTWIILQIHTKRNAAPRMAPIHWTTMYATLKTKPIFLPTKSPIVTAGLIWQPDTCPITFQKGKIMMTYRFYDTLFFVSFNGFIQIFWSLTCAIVATVKPKVKEYRTTSKPRWADPQEKNVKIIVPINSANSLLITIRISLTSSRPTFGKILFIIIFFYNSVLMVWTKTCWWDV